MGADIASACGQLVQKNQEGEEASFPVSSSPDIEDVLLVGGGGSDIRRQQRPAENDEGAPVQANHIPKLDSVTTSSYTVLGWLDSVSTETLDHWANMLSLSVAVSASYFLASSVIFLTNNKRRK